VAAAIWSGSRGSAPLRRDHGGRLGICCVGRVGDWGEVGKKLWGLLVSRCCWLGLPM
jgi:hypothetical protein